MKFVRSQYAQPLLEKKLILMARGQISLDKKVTYIFRLFDFWKISFFAFPFPPFLFLLLQ